MPTGDQQTLNDAFASKNDADLFAIARGSSEDFTELARETARQLLTARGYDVGKLMADADERQSAERDRIEKLRARASGFAEAGKTRGVCLSCGATDPSEMATLFARKIQLPAHEHLPDRLDVELPLCRDCAPKHRIPRIPVWVPTAGILVLFLPCAFGGAWLMNRLVGDASGHLQKIGALLGILFAMGLAAMPHLLRRPRIDRLARLHPMIEELKGEGYVIVADR